MVEAAEAPAEQGAEVPPAGAAELGPVSDNVAMEEARDVDRLENGTHSSRRGIPVVVTRVPTPNSSDVPQHLQIQYGESGRPGTVVRLPDVPPSWPKAREIVGWFCEDQDNQGNPFREPCTRTLQTREADPAPAEGKARPEGSGRPGAPVAGPGPVAELEPQQLQLF